MHENISDLAAVTPIVRAHHERWDGEGYPDGLAGEDIPRLGRLLSVADAFDDMTSDKPYRRAVSVDAALAELQEHASTQFDPDITDAFLQVQPQLRRLIRTREAAEFSA